MIYFHGGFSTSMSVCRWVYIEIPHKSHPGDCHLFLPEMGRSLKINLFPAQRLNALAKDDVDLCSIDGRIFLARRTTGSRCEQTEEVQLTVKILVRGNSGDWRNMEEYGELWRNMAK